VFYQKNSENFQKIFNSKLSNERMFQSMIFDNLLSLFKIPNEYLFEYFLSTKHLILISEFCKNVYLKSENFYTYKLDNDENFHDFRSAIAYI